MQRNNNIQRQVTISVDYDEIPKADSPIHESESDRFRFLTVNGAVMIDEGSDEHEAVKKCFLQGFGSLTDELIRVVAVHKNLARTFTGRARLQSFNIFSNAVANKQRGDANVRLAWYGASKAEISDILRHGFAAVGKVAGDGQTYGRGLPLAHSNFAIDRYG